MVTDASPCSASSSPVASRIASRTARRCCSIVSFHSFGMAGVYATSFPRHTDAIIDALYRIVVRSRQHHATLEAQMAIPPPYPGTPRWVKLAGIMTLVLVLLVSIVHLAGGASTGHTSLI